jgi:hypothetical protein
VERGATVEKEAPVARAKVERARVRARKERATR